MSPELMYALLQMGHGDEIVFGDANFPAESIGERVIRADGDTVTALLESIMPFFPLDNYVEENVILMSVVPGKGEAPEVWESYKQIIIKNDSEKAFVDFAFIDRQSFYDRAKKAFAVVATGEKAKYANIILKLGVAE
ncbi:MAG: RbsD/FucU domain-containing protein [Oscillospiraceae bacterium]